MSGEKLPSPNLLSSGGQAVPGLFAPPQELLRRMSASSGSMDDDDLMKDSAEMLRNPHLVSAAHLLWLKSDVQEEFVAARPSNTVGRTAVTVLRYFGLDPADLVKVSLTQEVLYLESAHVLLRTDTLATALFTDYMRLAVHASLGPLRDALQAMAKRWNKPPKEKAMAGVMASDMEALVKSLRYIYFSGPAAAIFAYLIKLAKGKFGPDGARNVVGAMLLRVLVPRIINPSSLGVTVPKDANTVFERVGKAILGLAQGTTWPAEDKRSFGNRVIEANTDFSERLLEQMSSPVPLEDPPASTFDPTLPEPEIMVEDLVEVRDWVTAIDKDKAKTEWFKIFIAHMAASALSAVDGASLAVQARYVPDKPVKMWNKDNVRDWMINFPTLAPYARILYNGKIDGELLDGLTHTDLENLGLDRLGPRKRLLSYILKLK